MRKAIIKFFSMDYKMFVFGRLITFKRTINITYPTLALVGSIIVLSKMPFIWALFLALSAMSVLFALGAYMYYRPVTKADYDYLDEVQKADFDLKHSGLTTPINKYNSKWALAVIPASLLLLLISYYVSL